MKGAGHIPQPRAQNKQAQYKHIPSSHPTTYRHISLKLPEPSTNTTRKVSDKGTAVQSFTEKAGTKRIPLFPCNSQAIKSKHSHCSGPSCMLWNGGTRFELVVKILAAWL